MAGFVVSDTKIDIKHVAWRGDLLDKYHALLVGGSCFDAKKAEFLIKKPTESISPGTSMPMPGSGEPGPSSGAMQTAYMPSSYNVGTDAYSYRLKKTSYKPVISSLFGYLASRVFPRLPEIEGPERYQEFLKDCDGDGCNILAVARDALINALTYSTSGGPCGSYLYIPEYEDVGLKIDSIDARSVIDWEEDIDGDLSRVRMRNITAIRDEDFGPQTKWRWTWKIYEPKGTRSWYGEKAIRSFVRPATAVAGESESYDYGEAIPFIRVRLAEHQFLMDQIAAPILEAFNLESDIASLCGKISNAQLVVETDDQLGQVILPQLGVIKMSMGGKSYFISPDSTCADPLLKYKDVLRESIYNAINASAMRASADFVQNPRQAATAKAMDLEPWRAWSETFSAPIRTAFNKAFALIADFYGEKPPEVEWPDPLDISQEGLQTMLQSYAKLADVNVKNLEKDNEQGTMEKEAGDSYSAKPAPRSRVSKQ
jgi:hypothetical protein